MARPDDNRNRGCGSAQPSEVAAQRQSRNAGHRVDAKERGKAESLRLAVEFRTANFCPDVSSLQQKNGSATECLARTRCLRDRVKEVGFSCAIRRRIVASRLPE